MDSLIFAGMVGLVGWLVAWVMRPEDKTGGWWPFETRSGNKQPKLAKRDKRQWQRKE